MQLLRRWGRVGLATSVIVGLAAALPVPSAQAVDTAQSHLVSAVPSTATPDINDGTVFALTQVGTRIIAGGTFSSVSPHASSTTYSRTDIVAWDAGTGTVDTGFAPTLDGEVEDLVPGPVPNTVYAAGYFNNVNGVRAKGVALLDLTTGKMVSGFKPAALNGAVYGIRLANGRLFIAGTFTTVGGVAHAGLASLNPTTGALDPFVDIQLDGHHNYTGQSGQADGAVGPRAMDISPDGTRAVVIGNFKTADGLPRDQIVMVDLDGTSAAVDPNWATLGYTAACFSGAFDTYMRDVDFSPDGSYFAVAATGGSGTNSDGTNSLCDTAARWETSATGTDVRPTWADYAGQDTIASVAITGSVVYIGGHERWLNNSHGYDYAGEGAVPRPGLGALDPRTGVPFSWNPGRNPRGAGAFALLATSTGLYVGSDTEWIGNYAYKRKRVAYFPLANGASTTEAGTPSLPGNVYLAGGFHGSSNVLYRVDAGGPTILASDGGPDWAGDQSGPSSLRNSGSNAASWSPVPSVDSTVPTGTPSAVFDNERWDPADATEMHWAFPVPAGTKVDVRLYFANRCSCTSGVGQRVFNVNVDGQPFLQNFDIVASAGDQTGTMRHTTVTSDGVVDLDFGHVTENPLIDGIEIVKVSDPTIDTGGTPIYRVSENTTTVAATDSGPAWFADGSNTVGTGSPFRTGGNQVTNGPVGSVDSTVPSTTPADVFTSEMWDPGNPDMHFSFPVPTGTPLTVRLYFANQCGCTSSPGQRVFNVAIDGTTVLSNFDIVAQAGNETGTMRSFTVTSDGTVDVDFSHVVENPLINGIEIVQTGTAPPVTSDLDSLRDRSYDGSTAGATQNVSSSISWSQVRGAFEVGNTLFYGWADGNLYKRTFDGTTFGAATLIDPYEDPAWADVKTGSGQTYLGTKPDLYSKLPSVTGLVYQNGILYYTLAGDAHLYSRYFLPESGIVGSDTFTAPGGVDLSHVQGMFLSGGYLYWASKADGSLHRDTFDAGTLGSDTVVSGPSTDGNDWRARALFVDASSVPVNQPPTARISSTCTNLACSFDGSASTDADGSIASYVWDFGDGATATVAKPSHTYTAAGTYTVTLTVTDDKGATDSTSISVSPGAQQSSQISFVGVGSDNSNQPTKTVKVPATVKAGDALLLLLSKNSTVTTSDPTGTGWVQVDSLTNGSMVTTVWKKVAVAADAGSTVSITQPSYGQADLQLLAYTGTDTTNPVESYAKSADGTTSASHTTPTAAVTSAGSWAVSYWTDKSSSTTAWTAPADLTTRETTVGTGSGRMSSLVADSGGAVTGSSYGGKTATTDVAGAKAESWTFVLASR